MKSKSKMYKESEKDVAYYLKIISVIFFFFGFLSVLYLTLFHSDTELYKSHYYDFQISSHSRDFELYDFQIYYDFVKKEGSMSFHITKSTEINDLLFIFPEELELDKISWVNYNESYVYVQGFDYRLENDSIQDRHTRFYGIENINKTNKEYLTRMEIKFKGKLYPNAQFSFTPTMNIRPPGDSEYGTFFKFNLGEKYICNYQCSERLMNSDLDIRIKGSEIEVAKIKTADGWGYIDSETFRLNYNKENREFINLLRTASFSLMFLGLIPTIELIFIIINRKKNKKGKK